MDALNGRLLQAVPLEILRDWTHQGEGFGEPVIWLGALTILGVVCFLTSNLFKRL